MYVQNHFMIIIKLQFHSKEVEIKNGFAKSLKKIDSFFKHLYHERDIRFNSIYYHVTLCIYNELAEFSTSDHQLSLNLGVIIVSRFQLHLIIYSFHEKVPYFNTCCIDFHISCWKWTFNFNNTTFSMVTKFAIRCSTEKGIWFVYNKSTLMEMIFTFLFQIFPFCNTFMSLSII